jgi:hypothetical protein
MLLNAHILVLGAGKKVLLELLLQFRLLDFNLQNNAA